MCPVEAGIIILCVPFPGSPILALLVAAVFLLGTFRLTIRIVEWIVPG